MSHRDSEYRLSVVKSLEFPARKGYILYENQPYCESFIVGLDSFDGERVLHEIGPQDLFRFEDIASYLQDTQRLIDYYDYNMMHGLRLELSSYHDESSVLGFHTGDESRFVTLTAKYEGSNSGVRMKLSLGEAWKYIRDFSDLFEKLRTNPYTQRTMKKYGKE